MAYWCIKGERCALMSMVDAQGKKISTVQARETGSRLPHLMCCRIIASGDTPFAILTNSWVYAKYEWLIDWLVGVQYPAVYGVVMSDGALSNHWPEPSFL